MNSKRWLWVLAFVILASILHYQVASAQKVRIAPSVKVNPSYNLPLFAAEEGNIWRKNGVEAEWVAIRAGAAMDRAMAARALDMGISAPLGHIRAIAQGVPEVIIADYQSPQVWYIFVRADSRIRRPNDLKGTKVGVSRFGGSAHAYGIAVAKALGLEKDIKWVAAGGAREELAALRAGTHDGIIFSYYGMAKLMFKGEVRGVVRIHDHLPKEWVDLAILARRDFAGKSPDMVRRVLKGLFQASAFVMRNADWTTQKLKQHYGYPEELGRQVHRDALRYGREPKLNKKAVENVRNFLIEAGILSKEKVPPIDKLITTKFVR